MHSYQRMNASYRKTNNPLYPKNISFSNFNLYMWIPVLVYESHYPRKDSVSFKYIAWKAIGFFSGLTLIYMLIEAMLPYL